MRRLPPLILLASAIAAHAQDNSPEAYRLDRMATQKLNEAAAAKLATPPVVTIAPPPRPRALTPAEQALREREDQAITAWRARVIACEKGRKKECRSY